MKQKHVGVCTAFNKVNYGSALQAYATQSALADLGADADIIDHRMLKRAIARGRRRFYLHNIFNIKLYQAKAGIVTKAVRALLLPQLKQQLALRTSAFDLFIAEHIRLSPAPHDFHAFTELTRQYHTIIVGSDQLWLPVNIAGQYYTLSAVAKTIHTASYATSFGVTKIPKYLQRQTDRFLQNISAISVREKSGQDIVRSIAGRSAVLVCDPTMLLSAKQWLHISKPVGGLPDKYIFCYFLGNNPWQRRYAQKLSHTLHIPIVVLRHLDQYITSDEKFGDFSPQSAGPQEFLSLIRNAECVCTDSFHATVFSLLFHTRIFVFHRFQNNPTVSTNSRFDTLLARMHIENCLVTPDDVKQTMQDVPMDWASIDTHISSFRKESLGFLKNAIGGDTAHD